MADRTITISGFSKTFSITGWRIGYAVAAERWARRIGYMNDLVYVCAPSPLQYGVAMGLSQIERLLLSGSFAPIRQRNATRFVMFLQQAGLRPFIPQGAYYILADVSSLPGRNSKDKAMFLLDQTGVASVPGEAFFHNGSGKNLVRFCFATTDEKIEEACSRLKKFSAAERVPRHKLLCRFASALQPLGFHRLRKEPSLRRLEP